MDHTRGRKTLKLSHHTGDEVVVISSVGVSEVHGFRKVPEERRIVFSTVLASSDLVGSGELSDSEAMGHELHTRTTVSGRQHVGQRSFLTVVLHTDTVPIPNLRRDVVL